MDLGLDLLSYLCCMFSCLSPSLLFLRGLFCPLPAWMLQTLPDGFPRKGNVLTYQKMKLTSTQFFAMIQERLDTQEPRSPFRLIVSCLQFFNLPRCCYILVPLILCFMFVDSFATFFAFYSLCISDFPSEMTFSCLNYASEIAVVRFCWGESLPLGFVWRVFSFLCSLGDVSAGSRIPGGQLVPSAGWWCHSLAFDVLGLLRNRHWTVVFFFQITFETEDLSTERRRSPYKAEPWGWYAGGALCFPDGLGTIRGGTGWVETKKACRPLQHML